MFLSKDLASGLFFLFIGVCGALISRNYNLGTLGRMGPGYFPIVISSIIALLGAIIAWRAARRLSETERMTSWNLRPLCFVALSIMVFGLLIENYGLALSLIALLLVARLAIREGSIPELAIMLLVLTIIPIGIFVYGLNLPLKVLPF